MLAATAFLCLLASSVPAILPLGHPAVQEGQSGTSAQIRRAGELRNASGTDWNDERYAAAALKLIEALSIYGAANAESGDSDGYSSERAITLRALVWNEFRAGDQAAALEHYEQLVDLANDHPAVLPERQTAYGAVYEHAGRLSSRKEVEHFWHAVQEIFEAYDDQERLAQLLLDRAGSYSTLGLLDEARADLVASIGAHEAIDDFDGAVWSRNNLAFSFIGTGDWKKALVPLGAALAEVREGRGLVAQSALGYNLLTLTRGVAENGRPDRGVVDSLWAIAEAEARASKPSIVAPERLLVGAMKAEVARVGSKRARNATERMRVAMPGAPTSLLADLTLHAAELLIEGGEPARPSTNSTPRRSSPL